MNRIFSYKALFILTFLYIQSIDLKVLPEELKVFPEEKGKYLICPNSNTLSTSKIPYLPYGKFTKDQQPNFWFRPSQWQIDLKQWQIDRYAVEAFNSEIIVNAADAFNSEIIIYDGSLSNETKLRLMPSFLDNTNIPTSYKSTRIEYTPELSYSNFIVAQFINYFFENSKGKKLTVKQKLYRDISYELKTNNGVETTVYRDGFIAYDNNILATLYCDKNNFLIFRDIQEITLPESTNEYGEEIKTNKTMFWIREMRFQTNVHDKKESTFDL